MSKIKPNKDQLSFSTFSELNEGWKDVSLLSIGEAKGHRMFVDDKSLETAFKAAVGKSIPAYNNHKLVPDVTDRIGYFSGVFIDYKQGKLKAQNFKFLDSYKEKHSEDYKILNELAGKHPETFGISLTHKFTLVWVFDNGTEIDAMRDYWEGNKAPEGAEELPRVRFTKIISADIVSNPAANDGLFSEGNESNVNTLSNNISMDCKNQSITNKNEFTMIKEIQEKFSEDKELIVEAISFASADETKSFEEVESHIEQFKTKRDIEAKDLKINELEKQLSEKEDEFKGQLSEKDKKITELTSQLSTLKGGEENFSTGEGEETLESGDILARYAAVEGFQERLAFYNENKADIETARKKL